MSQIRGLLNRNGVWYARIADVHGRIIKKKLSKDKSIAITLLAEMRKVIELQRAGILPESFTAQIKETAELQSRYLEHLKSGQRSESTIITVNNAFKQVIVANEFTFISDITLESISKWGLFKLSSGTRGQTINHYVGIINCALQWAMENKYIVDNPLKGWKPLRINEPRKRRDLRPDEVAAILATEHCDEWRLRWLVYFYTGLRLSAGASLKWSWIDFDNHQIHIPVEHNKSGRQLTIPIHRDLFEALVKYRLQTTHRDSDSVFRQITSRSILRRFQEVCKAAGLDMDGVTLHSVRHTVATTIYENTDHNVKVVQELLGHTNAATTMRYLHVSNEFKRQAITGLSYGTATDSLAVCIPFPLVAQA